MFGFQKFKMMLSMMLAMLCAMMAAESEAAVTAHSWDSTLATHAQNYANQCKWEHSHTAGVAETLYSSSTDNQDDAHYATAAVQAWMAEKKFDPDNSFGCCHSNCGHYCAVVRDVYSKVGCGVKKCQHIGSFTTGTFVVCQFKAV
nr:hypothetical protein BaRGS_009068 [Batillaria attramentaria]